MEVARVSITKGRVSYWTVVASTNEVSFLVRDCSPETVFTVTALAFSFGNSHHGFIFFVLNFLVARPGFEPGLYRFSYQLQLSPLPYPTI